MKNFRTAFSLIFPTVLSVLSLIPIIQVILIIPEYSISSKIIDNSEKIIKDIKEINISNQRKINEKIQEVFKNNPEPKSPKLFDLINLESNNLFFLEHPKLLGFNIIFIILACVYFILAICYFICKFCFASEKQLFCQIEYDDFKQQLSSLDQLFKNRERIQLKHQLDSVTQYKFDQSDESEEKITIPVGKLWNFLKAYQCEKELHQFEEYLANNKNKSQKFFFLHIIIFFKKIDYFIQTSTIELYFPTTNWLGMATGGIIFIVSILPLYEFYQTYSEGIAQKQQEIEQEEEKNRIAHEKALNNSFTTLNNYRGKTSKRLGIFRDLERLNKAGHYLDGINLKNAILRRIDLREAIMNSANLYDTNLYKADFSNAELNYATFTIAYAAKTNFIRATLNEAKFNGATLTEANFNEATLVNASFECHKLETETECKKTTNLDRANFKSANLTNADFANANLNRTDLREATLTKVNWTGADLLCTDFRKTEIS
ncbi:MAG TPA: hypothetical protein DCF68_22200 [Cyanothece sp. UBA12306]|nr:hypothetical protein [Cyanothece sp. UBA12306]